MLIRAPGLARNGSLGQRQRLKRGGHLRNRAVWRPRPKDETAERRCVVAHSRFPKLTNPASLREGAGYSVSPQRPIGKRETPLLVPSQAARSVPGGRTKTERRGGVEVFPQPGPAGKRHGCRAFSLGRRRQLTLPHVGPTRPAPLPTT